MGLFLTESFLLAVGGVLMGVVLGMFSRYLFNINGFYHRQHGPEWHYVISDTIRARLTTESTISVTIMTFVTTMLAGLYPASHGFPYGTCGSFACRKIIKLTPTSPDVESSKVWKLSSP